MLLQAHERFPHQATLHCYHFCRIIPSGHGCRKTALHQFVQGSLKHEALSHTFTCKIQPLLEAHCLCKGVQTDGCSSELCAVFEDVDHALLPPAE